MIVKTDQQSTYLPFEIRFLELEKQIAQLEKTENGKDNTYIEHMKEDLNNLIRETFSKLTPHEIVQLSRHPDRPQTSDYIQIMTTGFMELHGGRVFKDDKAIIAGVGQMDDRTIMIIGHEKGKSTKEKVDRFFGCAHPDGYRKAVQKAKLAEKFGIPILTLINTPGAFPGVEAEARGQAQAIAQAMFEFAQIRVPILCVVIGEGGSGGALGIGVGDRLLMLENSYYSVISPEGCSAILWKSGDAAEKAAVALKLTARDLIQLEIIDEIIPEPLGGGHRNHKLLGDTLKEVVKRHLDCLEKLSVTELLDQRYKRLRKVGKYIEEASPLATPTF